jgi:hypothetical protein
MPASFVWAPTRASTCLRAKPQPYSWVSDCNFGSRGFVPKVRMAPFRTAGAVYDRPIISNAAERTDSFRVGKLRRDKRLRQSLIRRREAGHSEFWAVIDHPYSAERGPFGVYVTYNCSGILLAHFSHSDTPAVWRLRFS